MKKNKKDTNTMVTKRVQKLHDATLILILNHAHHSVQRSTSIPVFADFSKLIVDSKRSKDGRKVSHTGVDYHEDEKYLMRLGITSKMSRRGVGSDSKSTESGRRHNDN